MKHQADLLIRNSDYLNETFELTEGKSILISDGKIEAVGTAAELEERYQWKEELEGSGCIYMPGLVDSTCIPGSSFCGDGCWTRCP